ncbi:MAG: hypothetical protein AVDCRST_MAG13-3512, partial [uncultured Solirubrobacteraceae bacterium]
CAEASCSACTTRRTCAASAPPRAGVSAPGSAPPCGGTSRARSTGSHAP